MKRTFGAKSILYCFLTYLSITTLTIWLYGGPFGYWMLIMPAVFFTRFFVFSNVIIVSDSYIALKYLNPFRKNVTIAAAEIEKVTIKNNLGSWGYQLVSIQLKDGGKFILQKDGAVGELRILKRVLKERAITVVSYNLNKRKVWEKDYLKQLDD